jgi:hypothetical protein
MLATVIDAALVLGNSALIIGVPRSVRDWVRVASKRADASPVEEVTVVVGSAGPSGDESEPPVQPVRSAATAVVAASRRAR